jgi:peptidoglycan/xylan/chitin deacetylase (PgdA/CDA1 family)
MATNVRLRTHVLMYHDVATGDPDASGFLGAGPARYKVSWETFAAQLHRIDQAVNGPPDVAGDFLGGRYGTPSSWSLTFDDGGASGLPIGAELTRRGWRAHFFVTTGRIGSAGFLDASDIQELRRTGHVIGSHSSSHPARMAALSWDELVREWQSSVTALSDLLGEAVRTASVPGGYYARPVALAAARAGIQVLFTSEPVRTPHRVGECLVVGRFAIRRDTTPAQAARAAAGSEAPWLRQYVAWMVLKPLKRLAGRHYERIRRRLLETRLERRAP